MLGLPVIGMVDSRRSVEMMETLLNEIVAHRSKYVILDITGVEIVDTRTADHFVKVMKSAELLGTRCVMTGIRPAVAQTLIELGVDLSSIRTLRNLQEGLRYCLREAESKTAADSRVRIVEWLRYRGTFRSSSCTTRSSSPSRWSCPMRCRTAQRRTSKMRSSMSGRPG